MSARFARREIFKSMCLAKVAKPLDKYVDRLTELVHQDQVLCGCVYSELDRDRFLQLRRQGLGLAKKVVKMGESHSHDGIFIFYQVQKFCSRQKL